LSSFLDPWKAGLRPPTGFVGFVGGIHLFAIQFLKSTNLKRPLKAP
jgi:hypothetical protein